MASLVTPYTIHWESSTSHSVHANKPRSSSTGNKIRAIVLNMPIEFSTTSELSSSSSSSDLKARWKRILSFAGFLEGTDELTTEWLEEFRQAAWGNRITDDTDDTDNQTSNC
jgi:hypothetical protein